VSVLEFVFEHLGRHIDPVNPIGWAHNSIFPSKTEGKRQSLRGPGKPSVLVSEAGVWIKAGFPPAMNLPAHVHWNEDGVSPFAKALTEASEIGQWYGVQFSNVGWDHYLGVSVVNRPDAEMFFWYQKSGKQTIAWKPSVVRKVATILRDNFASPSGKMFFELIDADLGVCKWKGKPFTAGQLKAARMSTNLISLEMPEAILPEGRRAIRDSIDLLLSGGNRDA
jgi:hypothetical protein